MNNLNLTNPGLVGFTQDAAKFMQDAYSASIAALGGAIADNAILSGCVPDNNGNISAGFIVLNGEVLPFAGGLLLANFDVQEVTTNEQYYDGSQKPFYNIRTAVMRANGGVPFENFTRIKTLKQFAGLPTKAGSDYSAADDNTLATITAVYNLAQSIVGIPKGVITMWSGAIPNIPAGWALCNGQNGTPNLQDKFIVGAGNEYAVHDQAGEKMHTLTKAELPAVGIGYRDRYYIENIGVLTGAIFKETAPLNYNANLGGHSTDNDNNTFLYKDATTDNMGSGVAHENRPPYYALAYIMKL
jgi:microcystin-dependent protein